MFGLFAICLLGSFGTFSLIVPPPVFFFLLPFAYLNMFNINNRKSNLGHKIMLSYCMTLDYLAQDQ